ncbi:MAG: autotransporter-associated beta strand repeat-containing protein, partial [Kiritimatiellae bacterium]|nr:autotransporter-associated beta strand repeat-containing protein [Kiritimatiellia bacterium]
WIKDGASDWTDGASYYSGVAPTLGAGDTVFVSNKTTVTVHGYDADSCNLVSSLQAIRSLWDKSRIVFDIGDGIEITNNAAIYNPAAGTGLWGELVKRGGGTLVLGSYNRHIASNFTRDNMIGTITVDEGTLKWPQNVPKREQQYGNIAISNEATLVSTLFDTTQGGTLMAYYINGFLVGSGTFHNPSPNSRSLRVYKKSEFSGKLTGPFELFICGELDLTGVDNTFNIEPMAWSLSPPASAGVIGLKKIGNAGEASSSGTGANLKIDYRGGGYKYLGAGETTGKGLVISAYQVNPASFDGGETGGVTFTGTWQMSGTPDQMHEIVLKGVNTNACILANNIASWKNGDKDYTFQIVKYGTGVWRFADNASRGWAGALHVREGTVQFDSIADAGKLCSLGYSTNLAEPYMGPFDVNKKVTYAFALGGKNEAGADSAGTLEYTGSGKASCTTRPLVLGGLGGTLKGSGNGGELAFGGVRGLGTDGRTLTLDGAAGTTNYLQNVSDSNAVVSLVKEGGGTWVLQGEQSFSGALSVNAGTLVVQEVPDDYSWYRFTVKRVAGGGLYFNTVECALYDNTGHQQFINPVRREPIPRSSNTWVWCSADYRTLNPGEVMFAKPGWYKNQFYPPYDFRDFQVMFNGAATNSQPSSEIYYGGSGASPSCTQLEPSAPDSWISLVMRLADNTPTIVAYDMMCSSDYGRQWRPSYFTMEGSRDGVYWDMLHEVNGSGADVSDGAYQWMSDGTTSDGVNIRPGAGWALAAANPGEEPQLTNVGSVSVASGATLVSKNEHVISKLKIDARGTGTFEGFSFAQTGALDGENMSSIAENGVLDATFLRAKGLENVAGWALLFDGSPTVSKSIVVRNGRIAIVAKGLFISIK